MLNVHEVPDSLGYYFAGFVDGEGSFHLSFRRRRDYSLPWKISLSLNVSQTDKVILALLKRTLGCGSLRDKGDGVWMFEVSNLNSIRDNIIPFFERFGFLSAKKKRDFAIFKQMADMMATRQAHLSQDGIVELLELRRDMNDGGKRKYSEQEILSAFAAESSETTRRTSSSARG